MSETWRVLIALVAGLAMGAAAAASGRGWALAIAAAIEPVGTLWTNAIRMTVIPLVMSLLVTGVASHADPKRIGAMGLRALPIFVGLLLAGGVLALLIGVPVLATLQIPADVAASLRASAPASSVATAGMPGLVQRIVETVPANPVRAIADGAMLPVVVFTLALALAIVRLPKTERDAATGFFRALAEAMLVLTRWVLFVAPIGVLGLAVGLGLRTGFAATGALLFYIALLCGVIAIYIALLYPLARLAGHSRWSEFARAAAPAQAVAISSRSSVAALPVMIAAARDRLHLPAAVSGFLLPFSVAVFRVNVPMAWVVGAIFLGKLYGVSLGYGALLGLILTATAISFSVPGLPSASLFLLAPVLVELGLPAEGAGILIALDTIPDMFKTSANVTSHMVIASMLGRSEPASDDVGPRPETVHAER
jgi:Na+/H+-dicarboxylate symporter